MTALTPDDLARIEELEKQASGAPWVVDFPQHSENGLVSTLDGDYAVADIFGLSFDAELIAALRNLAPALVAGVRSRDARIAALEAVIGEAPHADYCSTNVAWGKSGAACDCWKSFYRAGADHE